MRLRGHLLAAGLALLAAPPCLGSDVFEEIRERIVREMEERQVPSLAVAVAQRGEILWEEAFGFADLERGVPATPHTMYSLASISKPMTATGLMILVERGLLDLDRPINDYLGDARIRAWIGDVGQATVRRVADHTSGLPVHHRFFVKPERQALPSMEQTIRHYGSLVAPPGEGFQYSNLGYGILGYVIDRVAGRSYPDFMREEVFAPLGLEHTEVLVNPESGADRALRYRGDGQPIPFYDFDHRGSSAIYSCVHDLVRFGMFHLPAHLEDQAPILDDRSIREMQKPSSRRGDGSYYGIGWVTYTTRMGYSVVTHSGGMAGVSTSLVLIPAEKVAVAVLSNSRNDLPQRLASDIVRFLRPYLPRPAARERRALRPRPAPPPPPAFRAPRRLVGTWSGVVDTEEDPLPLTLVVEKGGLRARLGDRGEAAVERAIFEDGQLIAWLPSYPRTDGSESDGRLLLRLSLKLRENHLNGAATLISVPGYGLYSALSHWVDLQRVR